ncbi:MAG: SDR family NAD(P)-dependent oxidoreductase [Oscillospiraceae bacterium]|nr:SDR family NAD(P)-dependent oxidoreductase [Oscillospiraceae bacterium]
MKTVLIAGASSGIGFEAAKLFLKNGWRVLAGARNQTRMQPLAELGAEIFPLDVCDAQSCKDAAARCDRIDVLVNCAGYGQYGPIECVKEEDAKRQMDTNVFGIVRMVQEVAPIMRKQGSGRIINITSCGGMATTYLGGWYHMSKYAAESLCDALRMELKPFGIRVIAIEPGLVKTGWEAITADHLERAGEGTVYEADCKTVAAVYRAAASWDAVTKPETAAKKIYCAATAAHPKARYLFGFGGRALVAARRLLSAGIYDAVMRKMFGLKVTKKLSGTA